MGHALNNSLQDVLVRFNRMRGLETLWQPELIMLGLRHRQLLKNLIKIGLKKMI